MNSHAILHDLGITDYTEYGEEFIIHTCVFCGNDKKNLQVNFIKRVYNCWVCSAGGTLVDFIVRIKGVTQKQAIKLYSLKEIDIGRETDVILRELTTRKNRTYNYKQFIIPSRYKIWKELRGINKRIVDRYDLGVDEKRDKLVIPVMVNRRCVAIIRRSINRNTKIKYTYTKGFKRNDVLFGQDLANHDNNYVVLCEGPIDTLKLAQLELNSVSILGLHMSVKQVDFVKKMYSDVILALDNDYSAIERKVDIIEKLNRFCSIYQMEYDAEDPGELTSKSQITINRVWRI